MYKTFRQQEDEIRVRINRAIYSYPQDISAAFYAWNSYAGLLERIGNTDWADAADKISAGYQRRAQCLSK